MWYLWLIAAGIFFIIEIATVGFLIFWLGIGALITMCVSFFTDNLLIPLTKPLFNRLNKGSTIQTNAYNLVGKVGIVTVDINPLEATGQVKVDGEIWSAKSEENIRKDVEVEVLKIDGVKLIVKPLGT